MSSEVESTKGDDEDFSCGLLLRDIEEISKALYLHKSPREAFNSSYDRCQNVVAKTGISESKSDVIIRDLLHKDKKSSIWNWKPLKALTHIRHLRFNCCFFLHVHDIEGLPPNFNNLNLCVTWKRKADMLRTCPARVFLGMAEFEETLMHRCTIYVDRNGPHSSAKYEPKLFLIQASVVGAPTHDIGSRWIDLSRLLPLTLEELEGDKSSSGKWTTSFKLTGKAKGAMLNVSFGFSILDGNTFEPGYFVKVPDIMSGGGLNHLADFDMSSRASQLHNHGSVPGMSTGGSYQHSQSANLKYLEEIFPKQASELSESVSLLYQKFHEGKMGNAMEYGLHHEHQESLKPMSDPSAESVGGETGHEFSDIEFDVIEQGIEVSKKDQIKLEKCSSDRFGNSVIETIDVAEIFKGEETAFYEYGEWNSKLDTDNNDEHECAADGPEHRNNRTCIIEPAFEELDSAFYDMLTHTSAEMDSSLDVSTCNNQGNYMRSGSINKAPSMRKSLSLDDLAIAESIESDFLNMLGIDQSQDDIVSGHDLPRDFLILFEKDPLAWGNSILDTDVMAEQKESCRFTPIDYRKLAFADDFDLSFDIQAAEKNHGIVNQSLSNKRNAEVLENLETEALMHEWGLSEKAFQYSPRVSSGGFGSPVYIPAEKPLELPSIGKGLGPIIRTKDGGLLRSMNPLHFRNANNGARLIVQVSAPVVLPSAMGFTIMEMLQSWASIGAEKMCTQANNLMPLEDVTGKTMQQVLAEAESESNAFNRLALQRESDVDVRSSTEEIPAQHLPFVQSSDALYSCSNSEQIDSDYVSLEDLVPIAITNIEALLVEGLKIQSGMPDQEAPSSIRIQLGGNLASVGKASELSSDPSSERAYGLQVRDVDELIKHSLSLEEWVRLDSGELCVEDDTHENILKLYAAHCAKPVELGSRWLTREDERMELVGRNGGVFADNFTMGLKVQLRDPLRNYEMVGSSMLALVQVDRICSARQQELHCLSSEKMSDQQDGLDEHTIIEGFVSEQSKKKICQLRFKVSEAHLAGVNVIHGNKPPWGTSRQQQSGSRWLLSSGMAKPNKNLISNSSAVIKSSSGLMRKASPGDVLWSISFPVHGEAATWDDQIALNAHVRNPDIIFPTESVK